MELAKGTIGKTGSYEAQLTGGQVLAEGKVDLKVGDVVVGSVDLKINLDGLAGLDLLKKLIPGTIDDAIIDVAKAAFQKV